VGYELLNFWRSRCGFLMECESSQLFFDSVTNVICRLSPLPGSETVYLAYTLTNTVSYSVTFLCLSSPNMKFSNTYGKSVIVKSQALNLKHFWTLNHNL